MRAEARAGRARELLLSAALVLAALLVASSPAPALDIVFDYRFDTDGFLAAPERRALLERAAEIYTSRLEGQLGEIPGEGWVAVVPHPSGAGTVSVADLAVPPQTLRVFVGAQPLFAEGRLARGAPGSWRFPCFALLGLVPCQESLAGEPVAAVQGWTFQHLFRSNVRARRFPPTDFAPWGGFLSFASDAPWHFGIEVGSEVGVEVGGGAGAAEVVPGDRYDFLTSAVHELGHVLGIGTAESWATYTPERRFHGPEVVRSRGGSVALDEDFAHFAPGTRSEIGGASQEAAFTAGQAPGRRKLLTELDYAALLDIGWRPADTGTPLDFPYAGRRIKGDVNGDGRVDEADGFSLDAHLNDAAIASVLDLGEADVWPAGTEGFGDGQLDTRDLALLERAAAWAAGEVEPFELPPGLEILPPEVLWMLLYGELDLAAFRLLGWDAPVFPGLLPSTGALPGPVVRPGPPVKGDLDRDGALTGADARALAVQLASQDLDDVHAREAADVAPMVEGNAVGDGVLDEADLEVLFAAATLADADEDGLDTFTENLLNDMWLVNVGRPRHEPLKRWTEACLDPSSPLGPLESVHRGEFSFEFCSRDGTPWSRTEGIAPEEYLDARRRGVGGGLDDGASNRVEERDDSASSEPGQRRRGGPALADGAVDAPNRSGVGGALVSEREEEAPETAESTILLPAPHVASEPPRLGLAEDRGATARRPRNDAPTGMEPVRPPSVAAPSAVRPGAASAFAPAPAAESAPAEARPAPRGSQQGASRAAPTSHPWYESALVWLAGLLRRCWRVLASLAGLG